MLLGDEWLVTQTEQAHILNILASSSYSQFCHISSDGWRQSLLAVTNQFLSLKTNTMSKTKEAAGSYPLFGNLLLLRLVTQVFQLSQTCHFFLWKLIQWGAKQVHVLWTSPLISTSSGMTLCSCFGLPRIWLSQIKQSSFSLKLTEGYCLGFDYMFSYLKKGFIQN